MQLPLLLGNISDDHVKAEVLAVALAHEIGHTLNIGHDLALKQQSSPTANNVTATCECPEADALRCVMWPRGQHVALATVRWSACSLAALLLPIPTQPRDTCLVNTPVFATVTSTCGDHVVDQHVTVVSLSQAEQCDCGPVSTCDQKCCDPNTCKFKGHVTCAHGTCCHQCAVDKAGALCRKSHDECDLAERCDGLRPLCPADLVKADGESCANATGYCFAGKCRTRLQQCAKLLPALLTSPAPMQGYCMKHAHCSFLDDISPVPLNHLLCCSEK